MPRRSRYYFKKYVNRSFVKELEVCTSESIILMELIKNNQLKMIEIMKKVTHFYVWHIQSQIQIL